MIKQIQSLFNYRYSLIVLSYHIDKNCLSHQFDKRKAFFCRLKKGYSNQKNMQMLIGKGF